VGRLRRPLAPLTERGGDEARRRQRDERDDVVRVVDGKGEIGGGEKEVQAQRRHDGRDEAGAAAASLGHDNGEDEEGEGEIRGRGVGAQRYQDYRERDGSERSDRRPYPEPIEAIASARKVAGHHGASARSR
jgi:hypothetical protein